MSLAPKKALPTPGTFPIALADEDVAEYWQSHIDKWLQSGLSLAAYCRTHKLDYKRFYKWKDRLSPYPTPGTSIKLVEVKRGFSLNPSAGAQPMPPSSPGCGVNSGMGNIGSIGSPPGINGINGSGRGSGTGGASGIRFWCGEFCIELDVEFSSVSLRQLIRTLQGIYIKQAGDSTFVEEPETVSACGNAECGVRE